MVSKSVPKAGKGVMDAGKWRAAVRVGVIVAVCWWMPLGPIGAGIVGLLVEAAFQWRKNYA